MLAFHAVSREQSRAPDRPQRTTELNAAALCHPRPGLGLACLKTIYYIFAPHRDVSSLAEFCCSLVSGDRSGLRFEKPGGLIYLTVCRCPYIQMCEQGMYLKFDFGCSGVV